MLLVQGPRFEKHGILLANSIAEILAPFSSTVFDSVFASVSLNIYYC